MSKAEYGIQVALPANSPVPAKEPSQLLRRAQEGDTKALARVREVFNAAPAAWDELGNLALHAQRAWMRMAGGDSPLMEEASGRRVAALRAELAGPAPTPLEALLVERIIATWLQVQYADEHTARFERKGGTFREGDYWQRQQDRAHRRYLTAIRTLAQVRRLLTPSVQVNIADKQVNIAG